MHVVYLSVFHSFSLLYSIPLHEYTCLFIISTMDGHLSCCHFSYLDIFQNVHEKVFL